MINLYYLLSYLKACHDLRRVGMHLQAQEVWKLYILGINRRRT